MSRPPVYALCPRIMIGAAALLLNLDLAPSTWVWTLRVERALRSAPPAAPAYHTAFDRSPCGGAPNGEPNGEEYGPNGSVTAANVALFVTQFEYTCA